MVLLTGRKADAIVHAKTQVANHPAHGAAGHDPGVFMNLQAAVVAATRRDVTEHLGKAYSVTVVTDALNEVVKCLLPNKTLQRVKRYLRREARKPLDMSVKQHIMHIYRSNTEEIPCCPPAFNNGQCLSDNEIIDILLFGTPKSWQREMDHQGFAPLTKTPTELVEFMERIEMSEDFDGNKKVVAVMKKGNNKKKANNNRNSIPNGSTVGRLVHKLII